MCGRCNKITAKVNDAIENVANMLSKQFDTDLNGMELELIASELLGGNKTALEVCTELQDCEQQKTDRIDKLMRQATETIA